MSAVSAARRSLKPQASSGSTSNAASASATRPISSGGGNSSQMSSESLSSLSLAPLSFRPQEQHRPHYHQQSFTQHHRHHQHHQHHQHQHQQHQHQPHNMAHYKYHNDCHASVLTYEQVRRLDYVMCQTVPIHGRGNFPTLYVKLKELIRLLKHKLQSEHSIEIGDVRLNGGGASFVLAPENSHYNDLDLIFCTDLSNQDQFDVIREVVLECLREFLPGGSQAPHSPPTTTTSINQHNHQMPPPPSPPHNASSQNQHQQLLNTTTGSSNNNNNNNNQTPAANLSNCALKEAYVHKMVKVNDDDRWSLISLGVQQSEQQVVTANPANSCSLSNDATVTTSAPQQQLQSSRLAVDQSSAATEQQQPLLVPHYQTNTSSHQAQSYHHHHQNQDQHNLTAATHHQHQPTHTPHNHHQPHLYYQQNQTNQYTNQHNQFPNSIELKFVDRMRRKFEFSVDSFQIILDSLIQFYDYAPQSIAPNGEKFLAANLHSLEALPEANINTNNQQALSKEGTDIDEPRCLVVSFPFNAIETLTDHEVAVVSSPTDAIPEPASPAANEFDVDAACDAAAAAAPLGRATAVDTGNDKTGLTNNEQHQNDNHQTQQILCETQIGASYSVTKSSTRPHNDGYYHQIPVASKDSPFVSSIASSSGCSSSSSVVSSSSSSLSCDEDHEDLYCDPDSLPPSPASSSSLLGSATSSLILTSEMVSDILSGSTKLDELSQEKYETKIEEPKEALAHNLSKRVDSLSTNVDPASVNHPNNSSQMMPWQECSSESTNNETSCPVISENFYPTVICRSEYGNFKEALYHLEKKLIATRSPEEIRGGGLLKYCNLLVKNYKPTNVYQIRTLERYMCSRFFIDFSELNQQQAKLESYLANHFSDDPALKFDYLTILHNVVQRSTVCLMNHELRLTLNMIRELAYKQNEMQQHQAAVAAAAAAAAAEAISASNIQISSDSELLSSSHQIHLANNNKQVAQTQQQQQLQSSHYYHPQKPVLIQSGAYRVKLVNYTLSNPVKP